MTPHSIQTSLLTTGTLSAGGRPQDPPRARGTAPAAVPRHTSRTGPGWRPHRRPGARRRQNLADLAGTLTVAGLVFVVALWMPAGITGFTGAGGPATSLGRLTGLLASFLLLVQVLLMARIPAVERAWGQDTLTRRHRMVGFTSFWLMLVHIVLITIGYAQASGTDLLGQAWDLVVDYPGMLLATAGTLCLVMVVVTSIRRARRRMRYASWHLVHLYAYLGVGLALPHQLWTGQDFLSSPWATVFWWGLWIAASVAVLLFRVCWPLLLSWRHRLVVQAVVGESEGIFSVVMTGRGLDRLGVQGGQYCQWRFLTGRGWSRPQPFSVSAVPTDSHLRITVQQIGPGTRRLASMPVGTRVMFEGPYGTMTVDRRRTRDVLLIGAGVGITPMRALAEEVLTEPHDGQAPSVVVLHRVGALQDAVFAAEFTQLSRAGVRVLPQVGHRHPGGGWLPGVPSDDGAAALRALVPDVTDREVYVCGPPAWAAQVRTTLRQVGVRPASIHVEEFAT